MKEKFLQNIFLDTKKNLNFKRYVFTLFFTIIFLILPYSILVNISNVNIEKIGIEFWAILFSAISVYFFVFNEKLFLNKQNIIKFIINNILLFGFLIYLRGIINEKIVALCNTAYLEQNIVLFIGYFFIDKIIKVFIFFMAFSGVLALIRKEKISFLEGGKVFFNSFGKFFTILFFWAFYNIYVADYADIRWIIFNILNTSQINQNEIFSIMGILFSSYIVYFIIVFVLTVFKNSLKNSDKENFLEEKINVFNAFEKTINALKGRKIKFYGIIIIIYLLCALTFAIIGCFVPRAVVEAFMFYDYFPNKLIILITILFILIIPTITQIFIVKSCFKFMGEIIEKINFSKFIKIYSCEIFITILLFIIGFILNKISFTMLTYSAKGNYIAAIFYYGINGVLILYSEIIQITMISSILKNEKGIIKKSFTRTLKFFSWKFIPVLLGIYKLNGMLFANLENIKNSNYELILRSIVHFPSHMMIFFIIFIFLHTMILIVVNYVIQEKI